MKLKKSTFLFIRPECEMCIITKWGRLCMLALAKPNFFCFIKLHFNASVWQAFYSFMIAVAER
jgi:hypothetical protein